MTDPMSEVEFKRLVLDKVKVAVQQQIDLGFVRDTALADAATDELSRRMVVTLQAQVLAERLPPESIERSERVEFEVPASWWQHFKSDHAKRWWLRWLVRRRPVATETLGQTAHWDISLERYRAYPQAQSVPSALGSPVEIHMLSDSVRWTP